MVFPSNSRSLGEYKDVGKLARGGKGCFDGSEPPRQTVLVQAMDTDLEQGAGIQLTAGLACLAFDRTDRDRSDRQPGTYTELAHV